MTNMNEQEKIQMMTEELISTIGNLVVESTNDIIEPLEFLKELERHRNNYYEKINEFREKDEN